MQDYIIPQTKVQSHSFLNSGANTVLLDCSIDVFKYNFQNSQSTVFSCKVSTHTTYKDPYNYNQAASNPRWIEAMHKELSALETNNT